MCHCGCMLVAEEENQIVVERCRGIETLKIKQINGETLENTRCPKLKKEDGLRKNYIC